MLILLVAQNINFEREGKCFTAWKIETVVLHCFVNFVAKRAYLVNSYAGHLVAISRFGKKMTRVHVDFLVTD